MNNIVSNQCLECKESFDSLSGLHRHFKTHDLTPEIYYQKYYPRKDLFTNEFIKFKSLEHYLNHDFNTRTSFSSWLKAQPKEKAIEYCRETLHKYKELKQIKYSPTQIELKSTELMPSMTTFCPLFDYYDACKSLGYENRFNFPADSIKHSELTNHNYHIIIDTREQKPLDLNYRTQIGKLDFGDYGFSHPDLIGNIYIERKSLVDFIGTMSSGYERFEKEIIRAKESNAYLFILVEETLGTALGFNFIPWLSKQIKATPAFIFHRVRELIQKYDNIQFVFPGTRAKSVDLIKKLFFSVPPGVYKTIDVQYLIDSKRI